MAPVLSSTLSATHTTAQTFVRCNFINYGFALRGRGVWLRAYSVVREASPSMSVAGMPCTNSSTLFDTILRALRIVRQLMIK